MHRNTILRVFRELLQCHRRSPVHSWVVADHVANDGRHGSQATQLLGVLCVRCTTRYGSRQIFSQQIVRGVHQMSQHGNNLVIGEDRQVFSVLGDGGNGGTNGRQDKVIPRAKQPDDQL